MSFVDFYRHQYAFSPSVGTSLLCWNKLTTPKETILKRKNHKKDREELSKFDFPITLLSPNPVGLHYFELFGLSVGIYTTLKEEYRTIEFIKRYLSQVLVDHSEDPEWNNSLFSYDKNFKPMNSEIFPNSEDFEIPLNQVPLSEIFLEGENYKIILECLT